MSGKTIDAYYEGYRQALRDVYETIDHDQVELTEDRLWLHLTQLQQEAGADRSIDDLERTLDRLDLVLNEANEEDYE